MVCWEWYFFLNNFASSTMEKQVGSMKWNRSRAVFRFRRGTISTWDLVKSIVVAVHFLKQNINRIMPFDRRFNQGYILVSNSFFRNISLVLFLLTAVFIYHLYFISILIFRQYFLRERSIFSYYSHSNEVRLHPGYWFSKN